MSNILAAGLEPYYSAPYDDKENVSRKLINDLAGIEGAVNTYRDKRNRAMVMEAECYVAAGNQEKAMPILLNALDLLSMSDKQWWDIARNLLFSIVEYK